MFILGPIYMSAIERPISSDARESRMAAILSMFQASHMGHAAIHAAIHSAIHSAICPSQLASGLAVTLSMLWRKGSANTGDGVDGLFDRVWYDFGGAALMSIVVGDIFLIPLVIDGFRPFDVQISRRIIAPNASSQLYMNRAYALENPFYLPFRVQLLIKIYVLCVGFGYPCPGLYLVVLIYCYTSASRHAIIRTQIISTPKCHPNVIRCCVTSRTSSASSTRYRSHRPR